MKNVSLIAKKKADGVNFVELGGANININRLKKNEYFLYRLIDAFIGKDGEDDNSNDEMLGKIGYKIDQAMLFREIKDAIEGKMKVYDAVSHKYNENSVYLFSINYYKYSVLLDVRYSEKDGLFITDIIDEPTDGRVRLHFIAFKRLMQDEGVFLLIETNAGNYMARVSKDEVVKINASEVVKDVFYVVKMSFGELLYLKDRDEINTEVVNRSEFLIEMF